MNKNCTNVPEGAYTYAKSLGGTLRPTGGVAARRIFANLVRKALVGENYFDVIQLGVVRRDLRTSLNQRLPLDTVGSEYIENMCRPQT
jgi:hypothetical protein